MPSDAYSPSVRDLLLVIVFQLAVCTLLLVEIANATRGYDSLLGLAGQLVGGVMAVGAMLIVLARRGWGPGSSV